MADTADNGRQNGTKVVNGSIDLIASQLMSPDSGCTAGPPLFAQPSPDR